MPFDAPEQRLAIAASEQVAAGSYRLNSLPQVVARLPREQAFGVGSPLRQAVGGFPKEGKWMQELRVFPPQAGIFLTAHQALA
ncbi:MAG: hypothetical protein EBU59_04405 [Planctomycetia bacterium]|nr:hypothetical protein [Planctomycetia bacterium]